MVREFPRIIEKPQAGFTGRLYKGTLPLNSIWRAYTERAGCASRCRLTSAFRHSQRRSRSVQPLKKQICPADFVMNSSVILSSLHSCRTDVVFLVHKPWIAALLRVSNRSFLPRRLSLPVNVAQRRHGNAKSIHPDSLSRGIQGIETPRSACATGPDSSSSGNIRSYTRTCSRRSDLLSSDCSRRMQ